jgi:hypothetical protein
MNRLSAAVSASILAGGLCLIGTSSAHAATTFNCQTVILVPGDLGLLSGISCTGPTDVTTGTVTEVPTMRTYRCTDLHATTIVNQPGVRGAGCVRTSGPLNANPGRAGNCPGALSAYVWSRNSPK